MAQYDSLECQQQDSSSRLPHGTKRASNFCRPTLSLSFLCRFDMNTIHNSVGRGTVERAMGLGKMHFRDDLNDLLRRQPRVYNHRE